MIVFEFHIEQRKQSKTGCKGQHQIYQLWDNRGNLGIWEIWEKVVPEDEIPARGLEQEMWKHSSTSRATATSTDISKWYHRCVEDLGSGA